MVEEIVGRNSKPHETFAAPFCSGLQQALNWSPFDLSTH